MLAIPLICTAVVALTNWHTRVRPNRLLESLSKPLTTMLVIWIAFVAGGPHLSTALAIIGLVFCLIGDIALLDKIEWFLAGLVSFLIGHLVFIAMFASSNLPRPWWALVAATLLVVHALVVGQRIVAGAVRREPALGVPVRAYLLVITSMAVVAAMTGNGWGIAGAFAFVLSDTLLGWRAFVAEKTWMRPLVMVTYHFALVGLALSLA